MSSPAHALPPQYQSRPFALLRVDELLWLLLALGVLWWCARGLVPGATGLNDRYAVSVAEIVTTPDLNLRPALSKNYRRLWKACLPVDLSNGASDDQASLTQQQAAQDAALRSPDCGTLQKAFGRKQARTHWLNQHLFKYIAVLALVGWLSLFVSRLAFSMLLRLIALETVWYATGVYLGALPADTLMRALVFGAPLVLFFLIELLGFVQGRALWQSRPAGAARGWLYAGWVLLTGMGLIWLVDYSARGHAKNLFIGTDQAGSLYLAYYLLAVGALLAPWLLRVVMAFFGWVQRLPQRVSWGALLAVAGAAILALGQIVRAPALATAVKRNRWLHVIESSYDSRWVAAGALVLLAGLALATLTYWFPRIIRGPRRWERWLASSRTSTILLLLPIFVAALAARLASFNEAGAGEIARWLYWWVVAWLSYRWVERVHLRERDESGYAWQLVWLIGAWVVLAVSLVAVISDKGQMLAASFATAVPLTVITLLLFSSNWSSRGGARVESNSGKARLMQDVGVLGIIAAVLVTGYGIIQYFGSRGVLGAHIAERLEAKNSPFVSERDFLAQLQWGDQAGGWSGFGVGDVPWCGWMGSLGANCSGVPAQIQSDYVFNGLGMTFSYPVAFGLLVLLLVWLFGLAKFPPGFQGRAQSSQVFRSWLLSWMAVSLAIQALMTVMGSMGFALMTGITLPLMGFGASGLYLMAVLVGIGFNRWEE